MKFTPTEQALIRLDMFRWLDERRDVDGKVVFSRVELAQYSWMGQQIRLCDPQSGIWNPREFDESVSILSVMNGPYEDLPIGDFYLLYAYQSQERGPNTKLKLAFERQTPLIYFREVTPSRFVAHYPVYIVEDDPVNRCFTVALDEQLLKVDRTTGEINPAERTYIERTIRARVHQPEFRWQVMNAYRGQCAVCTLKHGELLDAAHIIPDSHELGLPIVTNGMALCKIHHAAYDKDFLGISPDFQVQINERLLNEVDGPMLKHGIQEMHGRQLNLPARPNQRPNRENLDFRYRQFLSA